MMRSLYSGVSGLKNHQTRMDVIGNNISNVNTVAFKSDRVTFQDIYSQTLKTATAGNMGVGGTNPVQVGLGSAISTIDTIFNGAAAQRTDYPLDVSIEGDGFFVVRDSSGTYFTRAGNFHIDQSGNLVNANGLHVLGVNGQAVALNGNYHDISINDLGQLTGIQTGQSQAQVITTLGIAVFSNNNGLSKAGESLYVQTAASGAPKSIGTLYCQAGSDGAGTINPGSLEMSNVDLTNEFTDMIVTQRGFQANARVITTTDQMLEEMVNLKR